MNSKGVQGFRLICLLLVSFTAFAQTGPRTRVIVVDSSGTPVNTAWRSTSEAPVPTVHVREIDRNEAAIIDLCFSYVDAQLMYVATSRSGDGYFAFAEKIRSAPGLRDGLYWPLDADEEESPIGPKFAAAAATELDPADAHPFFGYYFKILVTQGDQAVGGTRDYRVDGRLIAGFGLVAWPAEYAVTGTHAFLVNHRGEVYAKDLGPGVGRAAAAMTSFAADRTWTKVATAAKSGEYTDDELPLSYK